MSKLEKVGQPLIAYVGNGAFPHASFERPGARDVRTLCGRRGSISDDARPFSANFWACRTCAKALPAYRGRLPKEPS